MKKLLGLLLIAGLMSSCAFVATPVTGLVYTDIKAPLAVTSNEGSTKVGTAKMQSILGIVATGDASIEAAAKSAGITKIHHVDYEATSIIGVIATFTVLVYGE
ncbi:MAG: TRL-like family protein [Bacteroidales bacterium]|nr:TRL-like family protein [Bacteroidales bacterium]